MRSSLHKTGAAEDNLSFTVLANSGRVTLKDEARGVADTLRWMGRTRSTIFHVVLGENTRVGVNRSGWLEGEVVRTS